MFMQFQDDRARTASWQDVAAIVLHRTARNRLGLIGTMTRRTSRFLM